MKLTNETVWRMALEQSAIDANCRPEDFLSHKNVINISKKHPQARKYLELPQRCNLISYGNNVVAAVDERLREPVAAYLERFSVVDCFEPPHILALDEELRKFGCRVGFLAEFFLPDVALLRELPCDYTLKILTPADFPPLYTPEWSNALCEKRRELDVLAVGAYDGDKLIGLAGCSADCEEMWQIGVDVLPAYREQGIASAMTGRLAMEIVRRGKVPFYCCAWSNVASARNAIRCGFRPAWVELTAKSTQAVEKMIR